MLKYMALNFYMCVPKPVLGGVDGHLQFPLPSMNRLNQTEPATFYNFAVLGFFRDSVFHFTLYLGAQTELVTLFKDTNKLYVKRNENKDQQGKGNAHGTQPPPHPSLHRINWICR
jgi:hypothetical protein